jgi:hypothetical protein
MKRLFWIILLIAIVFTLSPVKPAESGCIEPPAGLAAWWPGDGNENDIIGDKNGTLYGNATFAAGLVSQAFRFDGTDDYLTTPGVINGWPEGTIDLWVRFNSLSDYPHQIFSAAGYDPGGNAYYPVHMWVSKGSIDQGFTFGFRICNGGSCDWKLAHANVFPEPGLWYHLAGTWGSGGINLYVNGDFKANNPYNAPPPSTISNWIGASVLDHASFNGLIDEVEIFARALGPGEIAAIYNAGSAGKCKVLTNLPPVTKCQDVTVSAGPTCTAQASINDGSYDPDGDPITLAQSPAGPYSLGSTVVSLTVRDSQGASSSCTAKVTVVDNSPPMITKVRATPPILWPPNHKMVPVRVTVTASDNCSGTPQCGIVSVASNEPVNGLGDGDTSPDWQFIPGSLMVNLRAERSGQGSGRIYTVGVQCSDAAGNISPVKTQPVNVPHDQRIVPHRENIRKKSISPR